MEWKMVRAVGEAPGKILLIGEHAVVHGHPAIAMTVGGVSARAEVEFQRAPGVIIEAADLGEVAKSDDGHSARIGPFLRLAETTRAFWGEQDQGIRVRLHSTIPVGRGMGSGAALAVALPRAICAAFNRRLNSDQIADLSLESEREFHGSPSGVDSAVIARSEPVYFVKGKSPQPICVGPSEFRFVIADTGGNWACRVRSWIG